MKNVTVTMPIEEYEAIKKMAEKVDNLERKADELKEMHKKVTMTINTLDQVYHDFDKQLYNKYNAKFTIEKIIEELRKSPNKTPVSG